MSVFGVDWPEDTTTWTFHPLRVWIYYYWSTFTFSFFFILTCLMSFFPLHYLTTLVKTQKPECVTLPSTFFCRLQVPLFWRISSTTRQMCVCWWGGVVYKVKIYPMSFFYFQVLKNCYSFAARSLHHSSYESTGFRSNEVNLPKWSKREVSHIHFVEINTSQCAWWRHSWAAL